MPSPTGSPEPTALTPADVRRSQRHLLHRLGRRHVAIPSDTITAPISDRALRLALLYGLQEDLNTDAVLGLLCCTREELRAAEAELDATEVTAAWPHECGSVDL